MSASENAGAVFFAAGLRGAAAFFTGAALRGAASLTSAAGFAARFAGASAFFVVVFFLPIASGFVLRLALGVRGHWGDIENNGAMIRKWATA